MSDAAEFDEVVSRADDATGEERIALLEEAVRLADQHGDVRAQVWARTQLMDASTFGGHPEKTLVAFAWTLAQWDKDPRSVRANDVLWRYKWVVVSLPHFPSIGRDKIREMLADMEARFAAYGSTLRGARSVALEVALELGDGAAAREAHRAWELSERDDLADCAGCEADATVDLFAFLDEDDRAVRAAAPILAGRVGCREVPHRTYATLLLPLQRLGRLDQAAAHHRRGYHMIQSDPTFSRQIARHLRFVVTTGNAEKGLALLERHLSWVLETADPLRRFELFAEAVRLLAALGPRAVELRLPRGFAPWREDGRYDTTPLREWFDRESAMLAARFDARNGNDLFARRLADARAVGEITPLAL